MGNNISLSGAKGCGKSQVAYQINELDQHRQVLSFAKPLKAFLTTVLGDSITPDQVIKEALYGDKDNTYVSLKGIDLTTIEYAMQDLLGVLEVRDIQVKFYLWLYEFNDQELIDNPVTGRRLLQVVGTEFFRQKVSPTFWVDLMRINIEQCWAGALQVTVDDTRFPDEYELLKELGFITVKIINPELSENPTGSDHDSETSLTNVSFDHYFTNDKSLGFEPVFNFVERII